MAKTKMTKLMRSCYPILDHVNRQPPAFRKQFIEKCGRNVIDCCCEIARNIINKNVPLTEDQLRKARCHCDKLRELARVNTPLKRKRQILQTGGFLLMLLGPIIGVVSNLLGGLFSGNK